MAVDVLPPKRDVDNNNNLRHDPVKASTGDDNSKWLNPYEKLTRDLVEDERCVKEFSLGKRIGFYRLRGDLGSGNFAKVKLGFHCLAKGWSFSLGASNNFSNKTRPVPSSFSCRKIP